MSIKDFKPPKLSRFIKIFTKANSFFLFIIIFYFFLVLSLHKPCNVSVEKYLNLLALHVGNATKINFILQYFLDFFEQLATYEEDTLYSVQHYGLNASMWLDPVLVPGFYASVRMPATKANVSIKTSKLWTPGIQCKSFNSIYNTTRSFQLQIMQVSDLFQRFKGIAKDERPNL